MITVNDELVKIRARLHDSGTLWPNSELLDLYNDGYRSLLAHTLCTKRFFIQEVPGRVSYSHLYLWEALSVGRGTKRQWAHTSVNDWYQCAYSWEIQHLGGVAPSAGFDGITQLWERGYSNEIDDHFRFNIPRNEYNRIKRIAWDNKQLDVSSTKELDLQRNAWYRQAGEPFWWLEGVGANGTFEVFAVRSTYNQEWEHGLDVYDRPSSSSNAFGLGMPRYFSGRSYSVQLTPLHPTENYAYTNQGEAQAISAFSLISGIGVRVTLLPTLSDDAVSMFAWEKQTLDGSAIGAGTNVATYSWEVADWSASGSQYAALSAGLGSIRGILSPDRQYVPMTADSGTLNHLGIIRDVKSSSSSINVLQSIVPARALKLDDAPSLLPQPMWKYIRFYVLAKALTRPGEGHRPDLGNLYSKLFERGVHFMTVLENLTFKERNYGREMYRGDKPSRLPRVQLPPKYPRIFV